MASNAMLKRRLPYGPSNHVNIEMNAPPLNRAGGAEKSLKLSETLPEASPSKPRNNGAGKPFHRARFGCVVTTAGEPAVFLKSYKS
jgi:hypothetical protein